MSYWQIRLAGEGGQGLILAGIILAEAAAIHEGKNAVQTQSYGPESRGGASKSEVIISDDEIDYPKVTVPDVLLVMTQVACDKYAKDIARGGVLIVDAGLVKRLPDIDAKVVASPITETAIACSGKAIVANIVALGLLVELTGVVSPGACEKAVLARVPPGTEQLNKKALEAGYALAKHAVPCQREGGR